MRGPQVMQGYPTSPRRRPRRSTPTAGSTPATSARRRRRLPVHRRPGEGADQVQGLPGRAGRAGGAAPPHPGVADAAVIRVPDDAAGEVPKAFVVSLRAPRRAEELQRSSRRMWRPTSRCGGSSSSRRSQVGLGKILRRRLSGVSIWREVAGRVPGGGKRTPRWRRRLQVVSLLSAKADLCPRGGRGDELCAALGRAACSRATRAPSGRRTSATVGAATAPRRRC